MAAPCLAQRCGAASSEPCPPDAPSPASDPSEPGLKFTCPRCGVAPGRRCIDQAMASGHTFHTKHLHKERQELSKGRLTVTVQLTAAQMAIRSPTVGTCELCGQPFVAPTRGRPALFCSTYCRTKAWRIANPARSKRQPWRFKRTGPST